MEDRRSDWIGQRGVNSVSEKTPLMVVTISKVQLAKMELDDYANYLVGRFDLQSLGKVW